MKSPQRARSLFLSPHVSTLIDTKSGRTNIREGGDNTYLHDLEEHDRKIDEAAWDSGDENGHPSRTSTIRAVEDFFREYRPPSFRLKRLSYLDKALPPPPPESDTSDDPSDDEYASETHEYSQARIAIHSRFPTRSSVSTASTARRDSKPTRVSVRSRYSTQITESNRISGNSLEDEWPRPDRRPSQKSERSRTYPRKQSRSSIQYRRTVLEGVDEEKETYKEKVLHKEKEKHNTAALEKDPWLLEIPQGSLESDEIAFGNNLKGNGVAGEGALSRSNSGVKKVMKTSSDAFISLYNQCAAVFENRKLRSDRRSHSQTSDAKQTGLFAGCFWSRDGQFDDVA